MDSRAAPVLRRMMATAAALPALMCADEVVAAAARMVDDCIDSDVLTRVRLDLSHPGALGEQGAVVQRGRELEVDADFGVALAAWGASHPSVLSYLVPGDDRRPRRISDVVSQQSWQATPAYAEVFRDRGGRYQLSLVTRLSGTIGVGWVLLRDGSDFSDADVDLARLLLPQLATLDAYAARVPDAVAPDLTPREQEVLRLLATGATAATIGRQLGVAESTVRKHLEHLYTKLDAHDRLTAVLNARIAPAVADDPDLA